MACVFKRIWLEHFALSPDCPVGKKRKQWKKVEPWNGLRMVPETVSTVSTCQKLFLPVISPKKSFETISQILEPKLKKWLRLRGMGVESRAGFQQGNIQRRSHSTTLSIPVKRWILAKAVEVLHHARNIWRIHQTSPCLQMYSRSHVSWSIQHVSKGTTPLRAFALTSWYKAHTWLLVPC